MSQRLKSPGIALTCFANSVAVCFFPSCSSTSTINAIPALNQMQITPSSMAAPTLADVDNDGILEIIVSLKDALGNGIGGVQIWDVASAHKNKLDWPTGRGNYLRTGENAKISSTLGK